MAEVRGRFRALASVRESVKISPDGPEAKRHCEYVSCMAASYSLRGVLGRECCVGWSSVSSQEPILGCGQHPGAFLVV